MSYGPPPSDKDEKWIQSVSDAVDGLLKSDAQPPPSTWRLLRSGLGYVVRLQAPPQGWDKFWGAVLWYHQRSKK
jgi:hypothetical protein